MTIPHDRLPDNETLIGGLRTFLGSSSFGNHAVTVLTRDPCPSGSTFPSEIVTCQLADGQVLRLLCKYAAGHSHSAYGHRGGIPHEGNVYRRVLQHIAVTVPAFYGIHEGNKHGEAWIAIEYLDDCVLVRDATDSTMMDAAAAWLGQFHRLVGAYFVDVNHVPAFLAKYDHEYYRGWALRTLELSGGLRPRYPWLSSICERFEAAINTLLEPPTVMIHGEYYPKNILYRQGTIYPVDWEAAAIAIPELDLASLIESWPEDIAASCKTTYRAARWDGGTPPDFERKLDAAQLYWDFRWLGERGDWTHQEEQSRRFERLRSTGQRLGLL